MGCDEKFAHLHYNTSNKSMQYIPFILYIPHKSALCYAKKRHSYECRFVTVYTSQFPIQLHHQADILTILFLLPIG